MCTPYYKDKISQFCLLKKIAIWLTTIDIMTSSFCMLKCARSPEGNFFSLQYKHCLRCSFQSCKHKKLIFGRHTFQILFLMHYTFEACLWSLCLHYQWFKLIIVELFSLFNVYFFVFKLIPRKHVHNVKSLRRQKQ